MVIPDPDVANIMYYKMLKITTTFIIFDNYDFFRLIFVLYLNLHASNVTPMSYL